ncbi:MAG: acyltransferase family protein [Vibrio sp.]
MISVPYRKDIQGLRAVAVLAVMVFHLNHNLLPGGFVGVDVFLVISGFLITSILLHKKANKHYCVSETLKYFYMSRFKRIAPAYFSMLIVIALFAAVFFLPSDFNTFRKGLEKAAWFSSNHYFADFGDYFSPASYEQPLLHTWSLAVEIQFYLLAPFLVLLLPVRYLKWTFIGLLIGLTGLVEYRLRFIGLEQATYYSLYARLPEFFAGGLAALNVMTVPKRLGDSKWLSVIGLTLIVIAVIVQPKMGPVPGVAALLPVIGTVLLLSQPAQYWVDKLLSSSILVWVGALSYSLYLWHWPVLAFLRYFTGTEVLSFELTLLFVVLTLLVASFSYYGIESFFRNNYKANRQCFIWLVMAMSAFTISQTMGKVNDLFTPELLPIEYRRYADPSKICHGQIVDDCLQGDLSSDREILVLGDSHAAMLNHFFDHLGKELGFKSRIITASNCVTIPSFDYQRIPEYSKSTCLQQLKEAEKFIGESKYIFIAAFWSWHLQSQDFKIALESFISEADEYKKIYLLGQEPLLSKSPERSQRFSNLKLDDPLTIDESYKVTNSWLKQLAIKYQEKSIYLESDTLVIFNNPPYYNGVPLYFDAHHLNEIGAKLYAESFAKEIEMIFRKS